MEFITFFDDLPDLVLIELFSYLSSIDVLWIFGHLNSRLTALVGERGFFRHVNLSPARRRQFDTLLRLLPVDKIETVVIDSNASPLQLSRWPYLPRLTRLRLKGFREFDSVITFVNLHPATLTQGRIHYQADQCDRIPKIGNFRFPPADCIKK
jgi:hypothetical protein